MNDWNSTKPPAPEPRAWNEVPAPKHWRDMTVQERARVMLLLKLTRPVTK